MAQSRVLDWTRRSVGVAARRKDQMSEGQRRGLVIVLSVLIAFVLWFTFSMRENYSVVVEMPIEIGRLPEGRALRTPPPAQARVTLQGVGWEIMKLRRTPPVLLVHAVDDQVDVLAAASESARLPPGLAVTSASPSTIRLELDPEITRTLPIQLVSEIEPAQNYDLLAQPRLSPDTVRVTGARSLLLGMESFPTQSLVQRDVRQTVTTQLPLADTLGGLLRTSVSHVNVTVPVALFTEASRELPVHVDGAPPGSPPIVLLPGRVRVTYRIPVEQYDRSLRTPDFYAFVPYATVINDTTGSVQSVVQLPTNLTVRDVRVEPRRVRYRIRID